MIQDKQVKKVKQYRVAKTVFYCLGFPLFFVAVFLCAVRFIGNDPFTGTSDFTTQLGMFKSIEILFTSPALYGVWIAFGMWAFVAIIHIILSKTVKNRRVRTLSVVALCLVVMLGGMFVIDAVLGAKVDTIIKNAPEGVTVADYKTQLSYYRTISSTMKPSNNMTTSLIEKVKHLEKVYNVDMLGIDKSGVAGNISNKPVTYYNVISDDGESGVDISFAMDDATGKPKLVCDTNSGNTFKGDGVIKADIEGRELITLAPNGNGQLVINGKTYSHYFYVCRKSVQGPDVYVWYTSDMMPSSWTWKHNAKDNSGSKSTIKPEDGMYGKGLYNANGLVSDGWVFNLYNVLDILEDYYEAKGAIDNGDENGTSEQYQSYYTQMYSNASKARDDYYNGRIPDANGEYVDKWTKALYGQELMMTERFSITRGELDELVAKVGALLGDNSLFDYLLINIDTFVGDVGVGGIVESALGSALGALFKQLNAGMSLRELLGKFSMAEETVNTVIDLIKTAADIKDESVTDIYITAAYKAKDAFGREQDHLYIALIKGGAEGAMGTDPANDVIIEIDLDDRIIDPDTGARAIDLDAVSNFLNTALNNLLEKYNIDISGGIVNTIVGLVLEDMDVNGQTYKGLSIAGINIPIILDGKINIDIAGILQNLLTGFYSYQSAVIKPVWEFYELGLQYDRAYVNSQGNETSYKKEAYKASAAALFAEYERAHYAAVVHGGMMGSALIGDNLGDGSYPASLGLTDLQSVRQLKTDLSYQREYFPIYALRDMLASFTAIVILFYFLSFMAAQKEEDYASGKIAPRDRKSKGKKSDDADDLDMLKDSDNSDGQSDGANEDAATIEDGEKSTSDLPEASDANAPEDGEDTVLPVSQNSDKEVR